MPVCQQGAVGLSLKEDVLKDVNALPYKPNGFSRNERLQSRSDFEAVYSGKRLFGKYFILYYKYDNTLLNRKIGFTVSKKVSSLAVKRNKLKRRLREVYRCNKNILPVGLYLLVRSLPQSIEADFNEIRKEIISLFTSVASKKLSHRADKNI